jgi:hypothetical protein
MIEKASQVDPKPPLMEALNYSLNRWELLYRYTQDGRLSIDNNSAERSVRGVGLGRNNYMFFGPDDGRDRTTILYSLIETCKLNGIDPQCYLHYVLERVADHPINRVHELLPWNLATQLNQPAAVPGDGRLEAAMKKQTPVDAPLRAKKKPSPTRCFGWTPHSDKPCPVTKSLTRCSQKSSGADPVTG